MREILFRAKTTKKTVKHEFDNIWVVGNLIKSDDKYYIHPLCNRVAVKNELGKIIIMHEVQPDTISQYTCVDDKNGNKIYENDILVANLDEEYQDDITCAKVIWHKNGFYTKESNRIFPLDEFHTKYFEVCGNVFDNPELLDD